MSISLQTQLTTRMLFENNLEEAASPYRIIKSPHAFTKATRVEPEDLFAFRRINKTIESWIESLRNPAPRIERSGQNSIKTREVFRLSAKVPSPMPVYAYCFEPNIFGVPYRSGGRRIFFTTIRRNIITFEWHTRGFLYLKFLKHIELCGFGI